MMMMEKKPRKMGIFRLIQYSMKNRHIHRIKKNFSVIFLKINKKNFLFSALKQTLIYDFWVAFSDIFAQDTLMLLTNIPMMKHFFCF